MNIQDEPKATLRCFRCRGRGRTFKGDLCENRTVAEVLRIAQLVHDKPSEYYEQTEVCADCGGTGEIENPEVKR
jgi:hypothetical protein